eukprot:scpid78529/ scgid10294/ 
MFVLLFVLTLSLGMGDAHQINNKRSVADVKVVELVSRLKQDRRYAVRRSGEGYDDVCNVSAVHDGDIYCDVVSLEKLAACLQFNIFLSGANAFVGSNLTFRKLESAVYAALALLVPKMAYLRWDRCKKVIPSHIRTMNDCNSYIVREILSLCPKARNETSRIASILAQQPKENPGPKCYKVTAYDWIPLFKNGMLALS